MSWEKVRLGDIAEFSNGINFGKDDYGKGIKIIGVSNFGDKFSPEYDSLTEVKEEVVKSNDYLYPGDIVFVRSNGNKELVGRCMLIDNKADKVTYSGFCIRARLKDTTKHNPTFWTYHFKNQSFRKAMAGTAVGANIQNLSQGRLADYVTTVPDYDSQVRIAKWLSVYDNLIENNKKQIKLLEEAAERLYREWFVDFHFPGCFRTGDIRCYFNGCYDAGDGWSYSYKNNKSSGSARCKNYPYHCYDCKRIQGRCRKVYGSRNERTSCKAVG